MTERRTHGTADLSLVRTLVMMGDGEQSAGAPNRGLVCRSRLPPVIIDRSARGMIAFVWRPPHPILRAWRPGQIEVD